MCAIKQSATAFAFDICNFLCWFETFLYDVILIVSGSYELLFYLKPKRIYFIFKNYWILFTENHTKFLYFSLCKYYVLIKFPLSTRWWIFRFWDYQNIITIILTIFYVLRNNVCLAYCAIFLTSSSCWYHDVAYLKTNPLNLIKLIIFLAVSHKQKSDEKGQSIYFTCSFFTITFSWFFTYLVAIKELDILWINEISYFIESTKSM